MDVLQIMLWVVLPYVSMIVLVVGLIWRYKTDQYGWTSRSSSWNENVLLRWSSPLFHFGILAVAGGHLIGLVIPKSVTEALGISEGVYHFGATFFGTIAAAMTVLGLLGLIWRRLVVKSVRLATTRMDIVTYVFMCVPIALGTWATVATQVFGGSHGYDYRETIAVWFRSLFLLQPQPHIMVEVPLAFQLHIIAGFVLFCVWPFTRLVHVVSAPVGYFTRPYVVYRTRDNRPVERQKGW